MQSHHLENIRLELETMHRIKKSNIHPFDALNQLLNDMYVTLVVSNLFLHF